MQKPIRLLEILWLIPALPTIALVITIALTTVADAGDNTLDGDAGMSVNTVIEAGSELGKVVGIGNVDGTPLAKAYAYGYAGDWFCGQTKEMTNSVWLTNTTATAQVGELTCEHGAKAKAVSRVWTESIVANKYSMGFDNEPIYADAPNSCYGIAQSYGEYMGKKIWKTDIEKNSTEDEIPITMSIIFNDFWMRALDDSLAGKDETCTTKIFIQVITVKETITLFDGTLVNNGHGYETTGGFDDFAYILQSDGTLRFADKSAGVSVYFSIPDSSEVLYYARIDNKVCSLNKRLDPFRVLIEKLNDVLQGHYVDVPITIENSDLEMGGFDFLIAYDGSALAFVEAQAGQLLEDCGWEYFSYRHGVQGTCGDACPKGLMRIIAMAETNNGAVHPACYEPPDLGPHELATMTFFVTNDRTFECQHIPIRFFWDDCNDNAISSIDGSILYIDHAIYDFEDNLIWDEEDDDQFPEEVRIPFVGASDYCLNPDPEKPSAQRFVNFIDGGIDIICADSIDARGDINVNGVPNEIADAVMLTNYFIGGLIAFGNHVEASIAASDINADGLTLSVADLVYLVMVINGTVPPIPKPTSHKQEAEVALQVNHSAAAISAESPVDIGAGYFVLEHLGMDIGEPHLINGASDMSLKYSNEDGLLKVLVYSLEKDIRIPAGAENIFVIPFTGEGIIRLTEVQLSDYIGQVLTTKVKDEPVLPVAYALHQNYPNPFNAATTIIYELPAAVKVRIDVFNVLGQRIITLVDGAETAGIHSATWTGIDEGGSNVASGVYFYRLSAGDFTAEKKMLLLK